MIKLIIFTLVLTLFIFSNNSIIYGQDNFSIGAQYRVRPEIRNGYKILAADSAHAAFFTGQRTRLLFDYKKEDISFFSSIQDSRTWGDEEQKKDIAGLQVNELWLELTVMEELALKIGRQELVYDDHRLLGNLDWANLTISHDALLLKYTNKEKYDELYNIFSKKNDYYKQKIIEVTDIVKTSLDNI